MALVLYSSNDPGAPAVDADAIDILDAVLINGYGSKPPAGWTKEFSAAGKAAYRMPATAPRRLYLRVNTDSTPYYWLGYLNMTAVDSGTGVFPPNAAQYFYATTSRSSWIVLADDRTVIFITNAGGAVRLYYFGYLRDEPPGDINHAACLGSQGSASGDYSLVGTFYNYGYETWGGAVHGGLLGAYNTVDNPVTALYCILNTPAGVGTSSQGAEQDLNTVPGFPDNAGLYHLQRFAVVEALGGSRVYRGRLRGIAWPSAKQSTMTDGQIIAGTGDYAGVTIQVLKGVVAQRSNYSAGTLSNPFTICLLIGD